MYRRTFCRNLAAAGLIAALPACDRTTSELDSIEAVSGTGKEISLERAAVAELADSLTGKLYTQGDDGYAAVHKIWNGMFDNKHPAMVVQCLSNEDVRNAVTFARERELLVSVKGGGHSFPGKSTCDDGMMIDLSRMQNVVVDGDAQTAHVQGGALLRQLTVSAVDKDLVVTTGNVSHTGVGGFTLGGGMGRVGREIGLAIDNLIEATVVTAGGEIVTANAGENPDLFWALRGGGGNFGVVTDFVFRLYPFSPTVNWGPLVFGFDQARDLLRLYAEHQDALPDNATVDPLWFVGRQGKPVVQVNLFHTGDIAEGEKAFAPFLQFKKRLTGDFAPTSYIALQTQNDGFFHAGQLNYLKSGLFGELSETAIDEMIGNYQGDHLPFAWFIQLGGAISRVAPSETAYVHRGAGSSFAMSFVWDDPSESEARIEAIRRYYDAVSPYMGGFYTNFHDADKATTRTNYGENYPRLSKIKAKYDPTNLFRLNANIQPAV